MDRLGRRCPHGCPRNGERFTLKVQGLGTTWSRPSVARSARSSNAPPTSPDARHRTGPATSDPTESAATPRSRSHVRQHRGCRRMASSGPARHPARHVGTGRTSHRRTPCRVVQPVHRGLYRHPGEPAREPVARLDGSHLPQATPTGTAPSFGTKRIDQITEGDVNSRHKASSVKGHPTQVSPMLILDARPRGATESRGERCRSLCLAKHSAERHRRPRTQSAAAPERSLATSPCRPLTRA